MNRKYGFIILTILLLLSCEKEESKLFVGVPNSQTNITFENSLKSGPDLNILNYIYYYNGAGVATADFNNDHLVDIYFTSNEGADKLYLNKGNLTFEDITLKSNIKNDFGWTTGVTHVDINNDGLLDIYVCKVSAYMGLQGHNLLYINQGIKNGVPYFEEKSKEYGLDFSGFSTQSAFFDYDLDGDLDMFLLNHSISPNANYGLGQRRTIPDPVSGDRLYENKDGFFIDVSSSAGIFQGKIGYGLGISISDLNNDSYPDIYVGNDFFENDYLYINQKDGTFEEMISSNPQNLGHTTHYSMGNDIGDFNNDGLMDIISLDMLPEDLETYKASGREYSFPIYNNYLQNGYAPQYMQNTFHMNLGNLKFSEIAALAGIHASEWSWGTLLADYDNDGFKDIFISNGIKGATNDMDFINFVANDNIQKGLSEGIQDAELQFIDDLPAKHVKNYFFRNNGDLTFENYSSKWLNNSNSFSNGSAYADLDNDGDLEIVINNVDEPAQILKNNTAGKTGSNYLKVKFKGPEKNKFGVGAKVTAYADTKMFVQENYPTRGYLSAVSNTLHFGLGNIEILDSLFVQWPSGAFQTLQDLKVNTEVQVDFSNAQPKNYDTGVGFINYVEPVVLNFEHKDASSIEFYRDPLIPYANTNEGPEISVIDFNKDGLDDFFINGAKQQPSALFLQRLDGNFEAVQSSLFESDKTSEDVSHVFFDANMDGLMDLLVVSGGNEFKEGKNLAPRFYMNHQGILKKDSLQFTDFSINASKVKTWDMDNDGNQDIIFTSDQKPWEFGITPTQYLFRNDGTGKFQDVTREYGKQFSQIGNVKDVSIVDLDQNGFQDIIVVGHWMPIVIFLNNGTQLEYLDVQGLENSNGLWNTIETGDFDHDGDLDFVIGNWGLNSKLKASEQEPITLYKTDIDDNGSVETIVTHYQQNQETVFASKDELTKQIPSLNKKYLTYTDFAKASIKDLFPMNKLKSGIKKQVYELASCFFENKGGLRFEKHKLPNIAQTSNIRDILVEEINGATKLVLVGNNYEISTQLGRMDASHGIILYPSQNEMNNITKEEILGVSGAARCIDKIKIDNKEGYIITRNNDSLVFIPNEK
jgi:hypothetical protein